VEAGATAEITEPACTTSPAGWEGESGTGESSAIEAAGSEGSPAQDGLTAMGHAVEGATPVVPRRDAAVGVCAGVDEAAV